MGEKYIKSQINDLYKNNISIPVVNFGKGD